MFTVNLYSEGLNMIVEVGGVIVDVYVKVPQRPISSVQGTNI